MTQYRHTPCTATITLGLAFAFLATSNFAWAQAPEAAKPSSLTNHANTRSKLKFGNQAQDLNKALPPTTVVQPAAIQTQIIQDPIEPATPTSPAAKPQIAVHTKGPASQGSPSGRYVNAPPPPPIPLTFEQTVAKAVVTRLETKSASRTNLAKTEIAALKTYYGATDVQLLWTTESGLTPAAVNASAELKRADTYALNPASYKPPTLTTPNPSPNDLAAAELTLSRSILKYARHAKAGRIHPGQVGSQLTQTPARISPSDILTRMKNAKDPGTLLRGMHPTHPQFVQLRKHYLKLTGRSDDGIPPTRIPNGPALKKGVTHEHVTLLRKRLEVDATPENSNVFDEALETAVKAFQKQNGSTPDGVVGPGTRSALNGKSDPRLVRKIKLNMERWRWLPDNMDGDAGLHVWVNLAEYRVRVLKNYERVFSERAIVGLVTHKTPVFSDKIEWIEIHPTWFVPNSIKVNDILPSLKRKTSTVIERYNLKLNCGAHGSNAKTIDWTKVDIRKCAFTQPAGAKSVLGDFKFKFPNKHSVYLHDTHKPHLFETTKRTYSHGCVRVKNPTKIAHILLENDKGMTAKQLNRILKGPQKLRTEKLGRHVPIHMTYFTAIIDDEGNIKSLSDPYGHDGRLTQALSGRPSPAPAPKQVAAKPKPKAPPKEQQASWWQNLLPSN